MNLFNLSSKETAVITEMKQIAKDYGASLEVEEHSSGDYIDCIINKNNYEKTSI